MANILEICQKVADITACQRPTDLFSKSIQNDQIFGSVAHATLDSLMRYGNWQDLTKELKIRTAKGKKIYPIDAYVDDFYCVLQNTIYVKDTQEKVIGAITPEQWAKDKCFDVDGVKFKIQNNCIKFLNDPECWDIYLTYRSNAVCYDAETYEEKSSLTANTDIPIFDHYVVQLGITYRWLKRNGLDYTEEYNEYMSELKKKYGTGLATQDIDLSGGKITDLGELANVITSKCEPER